MRRIPYFSLMLCVAAWMTGCGSSSRPVQPQTSSFVFMQEAGAYMFTPMLGTYTTTGTTTKFTATAVLDPSTNQPVTGEFYSIVLSPDGSKAAVDLYGGQNGDSGQWDIFMANSDGSGNLVPITNDAYRDSMPQFSPDGTKVIFNSDRPGPQAESQWQIVTRKIDRSGEVLLPLPLGAFQTWAPTYSPDGSTIAVEAWGNDSLGNYFDGIVTMKADGGGAQLLTNPDRASCDCYDENPAFTSDGTKIIFSRDNWDPSTSVETEDIYIMNTDGSAVIQLTSGGGINSDPMVVTIPGVGSRILFSSDRHNTTMNLSSGFDIYSMNLDGTDVTRLTTNTLYDAFSGEWYESGDTATQRVQRLPASHHRLSLGHNAGHKVRW
jgi:Tol biopolymer transport system component